MSKWNRTNEIPNSPFGRFGWGFVYLLKLGNKYKIGTSVDLRSRVKSINYELSRNGMGEATLEHYFIAENGEKTESQFHSYFSEKRISLEIIPARERKPKPLGKHQHEWFLLSSEDVEYIKSFGDEI